MNLKLVCGVLATTLAGTSISQNCGYQCKLNRVGLNTVTTGVPFLMISPDARSSGFGDAGVASSPDANSAHWNPAKLVFIGKGKKSGVSLSYVPWLRKLVPDINMTYLSYYNKPNDVQAFGASLKYFSLGDIAFTNSNGVTTGQFQPNEYSLDFVYSRKVSERLSFGAAARYIYSNLTGYNFVQNVSTKPGRSFATDISAYWQNPDMKLFGKDALLGLGTNVSNIGTKITYTDVGNKSFIPINWRVGSSLALELDDYNKLSFMLDFNKLLVPTPPVYGSNGQILYGKNPNRSVVSGMFGSFTDAPGGIGEEFREVNTSFGMEYWYDNQFAVRSGYFYEHPLKGNRQYMTLGAGVKWSTFSLDFAYLIATERTNPLENTLRFSLLFNFKDPSLVEKAVSDS